MYLKALDKRFEKYFEAQKNYIFCKEGCSLCCEDSQYPYTEVEYRYLMLGVEQLERNIWDTIAENIERIKAEKSKCTDNAEFEYVCPFLINKKCCVYEHRGLICRRFGLAYFAENNRVKVPYCVHHGLNYSNVYDTKTKMLSQEMFDATGFEVEPLAYNVSLKSLLKNEAVDYLELDFGETRMLIDWFI